MSTGSAQTHFGDRTVRFDEKQGLVDDVFHKVADRYDLMNDLMSLGLHRVWKDMLVAKLRPPRNRPFRHLDVAGGTGDVAFRVAAAGGDATEVTVVDINADMLRVGAAARRRSGAKARAISFRRGQRRGAAVARRNFRRLYDRLRHPQRAAHRARAGRGLSRAQARRALSLPRILARRPAGARSRSMPPIPTPRSRRSARSWRATARPIAISSSRSASFPTPERFADMIGEAGFSRVGFTRLTGGVVAIHSGWKL